MAYTPTAQVQRKESSATSPALVAGNWYRIATIGTLVAGSSSATAAEATFRVYDNVPFRQGFVQFTVIHARGMGHLTVDASSYGVQGTATPGVINAIRLVGKPGTADGLAVEVQASVATSGNDVVCEMLPTDGYRYGFALQPWTAGGIPAGFTAKVLGVSAASWGVFGKDATFATWIDHSGNVTSPAMRVNGTDPYTASSVVPKSYVDTLQAWARGSFAVTTVPDRAATALAFTLLASAGGFALTGDGKLTVPKAGYYLLTAMVDCLPKLSETVLCRTFNSVFQDGVVVYRAMRPVGDQMGGPTCLIHANAGSLIHLDQYHNDGQARTIVNGGYNVWHMAHLGALA